MKARKGIDFMAGLRAVEEREGVQRRPAPTATAAFTGPEDVSPRGPLPQPSRRGKVAITHWVDPAVPSICPARDRP